MIRRDPVAMAALDARGAHVFGEGSPPDRKPVPYPNPPDDAAWHGITGELVEVVAPISETDPTAIALQFHVAIGSMIGRGPLYAVGDREHHANEYLLVVGPSAHGRKGDGFARASVLPAEVSPDWYTLRRLEGIATGEGLIYQVRGPVETLTKVKEHGITVSKPVITDPGVSDKRLLVTLGEFASIARQLDRQGQTLSPILRTAWDGDNLANPAKNSPLRATESHISIIAHTTAEELGTLSSIEFRNGGLNRFLICASRRVRKIPNPIPMPDQAVHRLAYVRHHQIRDDDIEVDGPFVDGLLGRTPDQANRIFTILGHRNIRNAGRL